jgi:hypothetical protein
VDRAVPVGRAVAQAAVRVFAAALAALAALADPAVPAALAVRVAAAFAVLADPVTSVGRPLQTAKAPVDQASTGPLVVQIALGSAMARLIERSEAVRAVRTGSAAPAAPADLAARVGPLRVAASASGATSQAG